MNIAVMEAMQQQEIKREERRRGRGTSDRSGAPRRDSNIRGF